MEEERGGEPERGGVGGVGGGSICVVDFLNLPPPWEKTIRPLHLNPSHTSFLGDCNYYYTRDP
jgi:hypothetical protein